MKFRDVVRMLEQDGWRIARTVGSHQQFKHPTKPGTVTVAGSQAWTYLLARSTAFSSKRVCSREENMKKYAIVVERAKRNYAAYVPDLPGCVATGATVEEAEALLREAIEVHIAGLREDGLQVPLPSSVVDYLEVSV